MKKYLLIIIILLLCPAMVLASTETYERTDKDMHIPDKVKYKNSMYNNVMSTPYVHADEKVYDFADLFNNDEELEIYNKVNEFIKNTGLDMAIVTINSNSKRSISDSDDLAMIYADDFYDYNDFDIDGLLYLIDMDTREFYISTSGKSLLYYDNDRIEYVLSLMDSYMYNSDYKGSIDVMIPKLEEYFNSGYSPNSRYEIVDGVIVRKTPYLIFIIISGIVSLIWTISLAKRNKPVKLATNSYDYIAKNGISIVTREDKFMNSHTTSHYSPISHDSGSSGGGSFHSGSSGISHGGGGHHF